MKSNLDKLIEKHFPVMEVEWKPFEIDWSIPEVDWNIPLVDWTELDTFNTKKEKQESDKSDTIKEEKTTRIQRL